MKSALITGFEDFNGTPNSSRILLEHFQTIENEVSRLLGITDITSKILQVGEEGVNSFLQELEATPDVILCFGQAWPGSTNSADRAHEYGGPIIECLSRNRFKGLDASSDPRVIIDADDMMTEYVHPHYLGFFQNRAFDGVNHNSPSGNSNAKKGGTYTCNEVNVHLMHYLRKNAKTRGFFCHLPMFTRYNKRAVDRLSDKHKEYFFNGTLNGFEKNKYAEQIDSVHRVLNCDVDGRNLLRMAAEYIHAEF